MDSTGKGKRRLVSRWLGNDGGAWSDDGRSSREEKPSRPMILLVSLISSPAENVKGWARHIAEVVGLHFFLNRKLLVKLFLTPEQKKSLVRLACR